MKKKSTVYRDVRKRYLNRSVYNWIGQSIPINIGGVRKYFQNMDEIYTSNHIFSIIVESVTYYENNEAVIAGTEFTGETKIGDKISLPFDFRKHKIIDIKMLRDDKSLLIKVKPSKKIIINVGDLLTL